MQSLKAQILEILSEDCRTPLERIAVMTGSELTQVAEAVEAVAEVAAEEAAEEAKE